MGQMDALAAMEDGAGEETSTEEPGGYGETPEPKADPKPPADDGPDDGDAKPADTKPAKPKAKEARKVKFKRRGEEHELDLSEPDPDKLEEFLKQLDDDHEDEWNGVGGKPVRLNRQQLQRRVELAEGALHSMELTAKERKEVQAELAWAKDNLEDWIESKAGKDVEEFALEVAERVYLRRLAGSPTLPNGEANPDHDPGLYHRLVEERAQQKAERKGRADKAIAEARQKAEAEAAQRQKLDGVHAEKFREIGIQKPNPIMLDLAAKRLGDYQRANARANPANVVAEAVEAYDAMMLQRFDAMPVEQQLKMLGDKRRAKLREAEVAASKLAKKEERQQAAPKPDPEPTGGAKVQSMESFIKSMNR